ncbi:MAG: DUF484 family protein [Kangiellaceae bacterium]|nr:DUF484 family protein [Kangiellaceae bacterium]
MKFPNPQALDQGNISQLNQLMEEAQVKNYLLNNPDFLHNNPQLLTHLDLQHEVGGATSLVEKQIKVLRERNQTLQGQLIEMLQAAFNNEQLLILCNQFMLELLACDNLQSLTATIKSSLKRDFDLDDVALILVGDYPPAEPAIVYAESRQIKELLNCQFPDNQPLCGRLELAPRKALFGELCPDLSSFALIPLGEKCEYGLLALASKQVDRFEPQMGTLFIELIAKLVSHLVRKYAVA